MKGKPSHDESHIAERLSDVGRLLAKLFGIVKLAVTIRNVLTPEKSIRALLA